MATTDSGVRVSEEATLSKAGSSTGVDAEAEETVAQPLQTRSETRRSWRTYLLVAGALLAIAVGAYFFIPWVRTALTTVSTDDAYVTGHASFVAPRIVGQVVEVLVDDNDRVRKGDLLVRLDREPYETEVAVAEAAVEAAKTDVAVAESQVRGVEGLGRAQRWQLQRAIEQVDEQVAELDALVAAYESAQAVHERAHADLKRVEPLLDTTTITREEYDRRAQVFEVAQADLNRSLENVYKARVALGLPRQPEPGEKLTSVPDNLDQTFSSVHAALAQLSQTVAQLGLPLAGTNVTPSEFLDDLKQRAPNGDIDELLKQLVPEAPPVKQAQAKLVQAQRDLDRAKLNLSYTEIVSPIDGVVTRRNVNPGNTVQAGQSLMAVRSLTDIWIDANFKETQLADLRIGQPVTIEVDMYGGRHEFQGRVSGFTMGTGSTLALLPAQNATGNFVKVVQRLPVRIDLVDYDPEKTPLFAGLSVTPYVRYKEPPQGPHAGLVLRPWIEDQDRTTGDDSAAEPTR